MNNPQPSKGERTRKKLVDATAALLRRQGYHATGLSAIVAESGAPRGSLYFHFPGGKDELACAAVLAAGAEWRARIEAVIANSPDDLRSAIDGIVELLGDELEGSGWDNGCPVAGVALESPSETVRQAVAEHYARWVDVIAERLASYGIGTTEGRELATVALSSIQGGLLLARVTRSRAPLVSAGLVLRAMASMVTDAPLAVDDDDVQRDGFSRSQRAERAVAGADHVQDQ